ncbi:LmeA family phospholipid-binding protein [Nocardia thraciensis]
MSSNPPGTRNLRRIILIVGLVLVLAVVGTVAAAETYYRHRTANCIATQVERDLGSKVSVSFGPKPLLLTAIDHRVQYVDVDSDDAKFGPAVDMKVHARLDDITLVDNGRGGAEIGNSTAEATWSNDGIAQTLKGLVSGVQSDPAAGVLDVKVLGGIADLQVKPQIIGDRIEVTTQSAQLFGFGLPTDLVDGIVDLMTESLQSYPMGLKPTEVKVTDNGIAVSLAGGPTKLEPAPDAQSTESKSC